MKWTAFAHETARDGEFFERLKGRVNCAKQESRVDAALF
jgi:hypothetical protein